MRECMYGVMEYLSQITQMAQIFCVWRDDANIRSSNLYVWHICGICVLCERIVSGGSFPHRTVLFECGEGR